MRACALTFSFENVCNAHPSCFSSVGFIISHWFVNLVYTYCIHSLFACLCLVSVCTYLYICSPLPFLLLFGFCLSLRLFISSYLRVCVFHDLYFFQRFYIPTSRQLKRLESKTRSPIYNFFGETISGASVIRAYGTQTRFIEESERRVDANQVFGFASYTANR